MTTEAKPEPVPPKPAPRERGVWADLLLLTAALALGAVAGMAVLSFGWGRYAEHNERAALRAELSALRLDVDTLRRYQMARPVHAPVSDRIPPTALPTAAP